MELRGRELRGEHNMRLSREVWVRAMGISIGYGLRVRVICMLFYAYAKVGLLEIMCRGVVHTFVSEPSGVRMSCFATIAHN